MKLEHIGIAVSDLEKSQKLFEALLNLSVYKIEEVESEKVTTAFIRTGNTKLELLKGTDASSAITKFIEKRGEGIHHIAFEVENIFEEVARLKEEGHMLVSDLVKKGADNKLVVFIHPKSAGGVLIELCQEIR